MEKLPPTQRRGKGRPTVFDPARTKKFCEHLRKGATERAAAEACGWSYAALMEWMARGQGRDPDRPSTPETAEFAKAVTEARGAAVVMTEAQVRRQAPLAWLYNRRPDDWRPIAPASAKVDDETISLGAADKILAEYFSNDNGNGKG